MTAKTDTKAKSTLDLSALSVTEAEVPKIEREKKHRDNPFTAWLAESYEKANSEDPEVKATAGRAVTVPAANAGEVEYLIRRASNELGIGARVVKQENTPRKGQTTVLFQGKDRRQRKSANETPAQDA